MFHHIVFWMRMLSLNFEIILVTIIKLFHMKNYINFIVKRWTLSRSDQFVFVKEIQHIYCLDNNLHISVLMSSVICYLSIYQPSQMRHCIGVKINNCISIVGSRDDILFIVESHTCVANQLELINVKSKNDTHTMHKE